MKLHAPRRKLRTRAPLPLEIGPARALSVLCASAGPSFLLAFLALADQRDVKHRMIRIAAGDHNGRGVSRTWCRRCVLHRDHVAWTALRQREVSIAADHELRGARTGRIRNMAYEHALFQRVRDFEVLTLRGPESNGAEIRMSR